jgi:hypothetical protein
MTPFFENLSDYVRTYAAFLQVTETLHSANTCPHFHYTQVKITHPLGIQVKLTTNWNNSSRCPAYYYARRSECSVTSGVVITVPVLRGTEGYFFVLCNTCHCCIVWIYDEFAFYVHLLVTLFYGTLRISFCEIEEVELCSKMSELCPAAAQL